MKSPRGSTSWTAIGVLLCFLCFAAIAQPQADCPPVAKHPTTQEMQAAMQSAKDRGFLWSISKGGRTSYLYGTLHVGKLDWVFPGPKVTRALRESSVVALEIDLADPQTISELARAMGPRVDAKPMPGEIVSRLNSRLDKECVDPKVAASLSMEAQLISLIAISARRDGLDPLFAADLFLAGFARGSIGTPIALETVDRQIQAIMPANANERIEFMRGGLMQLEDGSARSLIKRLAQTWAEGDLKMLSTYKSWCNCIKTDSDVKFMERINDKRNPGLADGIAAAHETKGSVFAAVGSLHMIGPMALPELMKSRGFNVRRIVFN